ncbi:MAG: hypothetical protein ABIH34_01315 [Nanoarchaeota archaeon]
MQYRYWFSIILLLTALTLSSFVMSLCQTECTLRNIAGSVTEQAAAGSGSVALLVLILGLLVVMVSLLVFSIFVYLKKQHSRKTVI